ncbi:GDCCVxC domain-containing (seleno)protein [Roseovarius sp. CAU 1744]|uniref:GDCCVxC domain-containing (seleno)protein n=1 Tax=Roseovarius sp. CAU 1744 TaxID=3140368 RepID=UPI00325C0B5A
MSIVRHSDLSCPHCGHVTREEMPDNACIYFYECLGCGQVLKPLEGDCCIFCSYGTVRCPPVQTGNACCRV